MNGYISGTTTLLFQICLSFQSGSTLKRKEFLAQGSERVVYFLQRPAKEVKYENAHCRTTNFFFFFFWGGGGEGVVVALRPW